MATSAATIMRTCTGWIATTDREAYRDYIAQTGLSEYRTTPGNRGAWMAYRDLDDGRTEVVTVSLWESRHAIAAFAGEDIDRAVFYQMTTGTWSIAKHSFGTSTSLAKQTVSIGGTTSGFVRTGVFAAVTRGIGADVTQTCTAVLMASFMA